MNWRIWLIITELLFGLCQASHGQCPGGVCPAPPQYGQQLVPMPKQSSAPAQVVRIYNQQGNGQSIGSGTLVDKNGEHGLILSCAHLFTDGVGNVTVVFPDGKRYGAKVLEADKAADLSALLIRAPEPDPWEVSDRAPKQGEPIYSAGYGQQGQYAVNAGTVKGYVGWGSDRMDALSITGNARQGDSGGPMFDRNHVVVGVLCGTSGSEVDGPCCLRIRKFLQRHCNRFGKPATPPRRPTDPVVQNPPVDAGNGCQCGKGCECDPAAACKCDLSPLEKRITELTEHNLQLEKQLALLEKRQPTPTALLDAAKKEPITVQILDPSGKVKQESKTYLGGTLRFQLKPVKKSG